MAHSNRHFSAFQPLKNNSQHFYYIAIILFSQLNQYFFQTYLELELDVELFEELDANLAKIFEKALSLILTFALSSAFAMTLFWKVESDILEFKITFLSSFCRFSSCLI